MFNFFRLYNLSAIVYLMLKVFLLIFVEVGFFPTMCGWWLDICSLVCLKLILKFFLAFNRRYFGFTFKIYFEVYPSCSMFLHWLAGMIYVFYSAFLSYVIFYDPVFCGLYEILMIPISIQF